MIGVKAVETRVEGLGTRIRERGFCEEPGGSAYEGP